MPVPKSVTKFVKDPNGGHVEYTADFDATQYYLFELSRAAMRDVGKFVRKKWQLAYDQHFHKRTGKGRLSTVAKVIRSKDSDYPELKVGLPHARKGKKVEGFYSYFQEFGTKKTPRLGLLRKSVDENIAEIVKIESQYLSGLSGDAQALLNVIDEEETLDED